ncbi:hypothetical protein [Haloprofundus salinisoli]|uniref:DUF7853 family protein n=1 Tax=Haloprofundus salinisoli TaxID=2876193 RepID=UPI001CC9EBF5|nr:hypothetical protein [Haloprofundus salinisoli]
MTTPAYNGSAELDLTHAESWVVHAAVLAAIERTLDTGQRPMQEHALREKVEEDETFTGSELRRLRQMLATYLDSAPERDVEPGEAVLGYIRRTID